MIKTAIYVRVSTDQQAKHGDSVTEQTQSLTEYVNSRKDLVIYDTYIDDGVSGQKLKRDEFQRLMNDVEKGNVQLIVFTKIDRWFRSTRHYLNTQNFLEKHHVTWIAVQQQYLDTSSAYGRAFVQQTMVWAELEVNTDSERIKADFAYRAKAGLVLTGNQPVGFDIVDKRLVPNEQAPMIRDFYEHFAKNQSIRGLMLYARDKYGYSRSYTQFKRMLRIEKYKGTYRGNDTYCPPIVTKELWEEVNGALSKNIKQNKKYDYVFSGLIRCDDCGCSMTALQRKEYKKHNGKRDYSEPPIRQNSYYRCLKHNAEGTCINSKAYQERRLEARVLEEIRPLMEGYVASVKVAEKGKTDNSDAIKKLENKLKRLKALYLDEVITLDEYKTDRAEIEAHIAELTSIKEEKAIDTKQIEEMLSQPFEEMYSMLSVKNKNIFWRSFVSAIYLDNNHNMRIEFKN